MNIVLLTQPYKPYSPEDYLRKRGHHVIKHTGFPNDVLKELRKADLGISYSYKHILKPEHFNAPKFGTINAHIGLSPLSRGAAPNVWNIINKEPAGVMIHWIDEGIDTGNILTRIGCPVYLHDTGETLYIRLLQVCRQLFEGYWPELEQSLIEGKKPAGKEQNQKDIPAHKTRDLYTLDNLEGRFGSVARDVVDTLRARTFDGHESAWLLDDQGRKVYIRVSLTLHD